MKMTGTCESSAQTLFIAPLQTPQATPGLAHDASAEAVRETLSALQPIRSAGVSVHVDRAGPFVGGGYRWGIAFRSRASVDEHEHTVRTQTLPMVGVQQANVTGTGVRVRVEHRDAYETAAAEQLVSLTAPLPQTVPEMQTIECQLLNESTPSEAANLGLSFALLFRGETTEVRDVPVFCVHFVRICDFHGCSFDLSLVDTEAMNMMLFFQERHV